MSISLPRYIHGMLQTSDKKHVFGDVRPIAYSENFPLEVRRQIYEKVKLGLNMNLLQGEGNAYGFISLNENEYVAAHYQLMDLTEPTSRGNPIFSEFIFITKAQIESINWNILKIFEFFKPIEYLEQVNKELPNAELEIHNINLVEDGNSLLHQFQLQCQSILVRYLSNPQKIIITSYNTSAEIRLKFLCTMMFTIPARYRNGFSFSTLASDTSNSVRIFFSNRPSKNSQSIDWQSPIVPTELPGTVYSTWVLDLINAKNETHFTSQINTLPTPIPEKSTHLKTWGDELDLAIRNLNWFPRREDFLKIKIPEQLNEQAKQILEFSCFYDDRQVAEWISLFLTYLMKLKAYDIGAVSLANHSLLLNNQDTRKYLASKLLQLIDTKQIEAIQTLSVFIAHLTHYANKTYQPLVIDFCKEILVSSISLPNYQAGLRLWSDVHNLDWARSENFFLSAINVIKKLKSIHELQYLLEAIGCPPSNFCFDALGELIKRSNLNAPHTIQFIENYKSLQSVYYFENVFSVFSEIGSYHWANSKILYAIKFYSDIHIRFIGFLEKLSYDQKEKLIESAIKIQNGELIALISFSSLMLINKEVKRKEEFQKWISFCKENCSHHDLKIGVRVCDGKWTHFSLENLLLLQNLLESKDNNVDIREGLNNIQKAIAHHNRIYRIENYIQKSMDQFNIKQFIIHELHEIIISKDIMAWQYLVNGSKLRGIYSSYQNHLSEYLLASNGFGIQEYLLNEWHITLTRADLTFESDLLTLWAIRSRKSGIDIFPSLFRWLEKDATYHAIAGNIISYDTALDKKYQFALADKCLAADPKRAEILVEKIEKVISGQEFISFSVKIQSKFSNISPNTIFYEFLKNLSQNISKISKKEN